MVFGGGRHRDWPRHMATDHMPARLWRPRGPLRNARHAAMKCCTPELKRMVRGPSCIAACGSPGRCGQERHLCYRPLPGSLTGLGFTGSGFQAAMMRAHSGACVLSPTPRNTRRSGAAQWWPIARRLDRRRKNPAEQRATRDGRAVVLSPIDVAIRPRRNNHHQHQNQHDQPHCGRYVERGIPPAAAVARSECFPRRTRRSRDRRTGREGEVDHRHRGRQQPAGTEDHRARRIMRRSHGVV
jgi:hypothetical protein